MKSEQNKRSELREIDIKIVNELVENSRASLRQVAQKVKASVATVMKKVKFLETEGYIKKYTCRLDYEKFGYEFEAMIEVWVAEGKALLFLRKFADHPNIFGLYDVTGDYDVLIFSRFKSRRSMDSFLKGLQSHDFVRRTSTRMILNTVKKESLCVD